MKKHSLFTGVNSLLFFCVIFSSMNVLSQENLGNSLVIAHDDNDLQWGPCPDFMPEGCNIAVLHGDPALKNADLLLKVPANSTIANHRHTSAERMILLSGEMEVSYEGEKPQTLQVGSYAYGPANKPHSATCKTGPCILFIAFEEPVDAIAVAGKN